MPMRTIAVGPLAANCYILWNDPAKALVVDPGAEGPRILEALKADGITPALVVITHGHFDHTGAVGDIVKAHAVPFRHHEAEASTLAQTPPGTEIWGVKVARVPRPSGHLADGERLDVGGLAVDIIHTPGHTPGSTCFYVPEDEILLTGDTLFQRSVGRSDLPGGNADQLAASIRGKLYALPEETTVYPGHGPSTSVGQEKLQNPFVPA
jgi:glyoxylase-like metal-dependent hydrolase (beta-lactamase superfamily II)